MGKCNGKAEQMSSFVGDLWSCTTTKEIFVLSIRFGRDVEVGGEEHSGGLLHLLFTLQLFRVLLETLAKPLQHTVPHLPHA